MMSDSEHHLVVKDDDNDDDGDDDDDDAGMLRVSAKRGSSTVDTRHRAVPR